jgi:putative tricarboxylic transport membrane protein
MTRTTFYSFILVVVIRLNHLFEEKRNMKLIRPIRILFLIALISAFIAGCAPAATQVPPTTAPTTALVATKAPAATQAAPQTKFPEKPVTLIVQASAGGGSDIFARTFASAMEQNKLLSQPIAVENKTGGSGAVAFAYVAGKSGDPYFLLNASGSFITTPLLSVEASKVNYKNFTPVANLALDQFVFFVNASSKFKTIQDLVAAAKANPKGVNAGVTQLGSTDSICAYLVEQAAGVKFNNVVFPGAAEVNAAVLGNNVDFGIGNPGEILELAKAGKVRALGVFAETRLTEATDVPTMKEQGINAVFVQNRGFVAPAGVSADVIKVWENAIQAFMKTDTWKKYIKDNMLTESYMDSVTFGKFLADETARLDTILKGMGVTK